MHSDTVKEVLTFQAGLLEEKTQGAVTGSVREEYDRPLTKYVLTALGSRFQGKVDLVTVGVWGPRRDCVITTRGDGVYDVGPLETLTEDQFKDRLSAALHDKEMLRALAYIIAVERQ
jgi:hypothetical protein